MRSEAPSFASAKVLLVPGGALIAWWCVVRAHWVSSVLVPPPALVLQTAAHQMGSSEFWIAFASSLARMASGFAIAASFGLALGVLLGVSRWSQRLVGPTFHGVRQIAPFAWIPLLSAWTGTGESTKVAFIAVASFAPTVLGTMEGARSVTRGHMELARVLEVGKLRFIRDVMLPSAMPSVLSGLHMSLISAWLATVGAEFFLQISPGLTGILMEGRALVRMDIVVFGLVVIASVGFGLSVGMSALERHALRWRPRRPNSNV